MGCGLFIQPVDQMVKVCGYDASRVPQRLFGSVSVIICLAGFVLAFAHLQPGSLTTCDYPEGTECVVCKRIEPECEENGCDRDTECACTDGGPIYCTANSDSLPWDSWILLPLTAVLIIAGLCLIRAWLNRPGELCGTEIEETAASPIARPATRLSTGGKSTMTQASAMTRGGSGGRKSNDMMTQASGMTRVGGGGRRSNDMTTVASSATRKSGKSMGGTSVVSNATRR